MHLLFKRSWRGNLQEVEDITERKNVLVHHAKCFSCLRSGHRVFKCRSCVGVRPSCVYLPKFKCHSAVQEVQPKPSATPLNPEPHLNPSVTSRDGSTDSCEGKVALQTALAANNGKEECNVTVLFDAWSHKPATTTEAVGKLGLRGVRRQEFGIKVFGDKEAVTEIRDVV